jgi:hypothetical protein
VGAARSRGEPGHEGGPADDRGEPESATAPGPAASLACSDGRLPHPSRSRRDGDGEDWVPADVGRFLRGLRSARHLEVLLFLRDRREREWAVTEVAAAVGLAEETAGRILFDLVRQRVLQPCRRAPPRYAYHPEPGDLGPTVDRLAEVYAGHPSGVAGRLLSARARSAPAG